MKTAIRSVATALFVFGLLGVDADRACGKEAKPCCPKTCPKCTKGGFKPLFDGKTLKGWEGDKKLWSVEDGVLIGRTSVIKSNQFLCTTKEYGDFELCVKFRLLGGKGNSGFQVRSQKVAGHVRGYQADIGQRYWGSLYDEKRRGMLVVSPPETKKHYKPDGWNTYFIRCQGPNIELKLNGFTTVKYTEKDAKIPRKGVIAPQLHVGPPMEIQIKAICIKELKKQ